MVDWSNLLPQGTDFLMEWIAQPLMLALGFDVGLAPPNCKKENKVGVHAASTMKFAREVSSRIQYKLATLSEYQRRAAA